MKTKLVLLLIAILTLNTAFAQGSLNDYKYVIVSKKYDFLKEQDQYQLNSLSKFLFNKYGFEALFEGENYPEELALNRCLALNSDVLKDSGLFKTKLTLQLQDCNGKVVYTSQMGESREKEYQKAYHEALREAFKSLEALNHKYEPSAAVVAQAKSKTKGEDSKEIEKLKKEIETLKQAKSSKVVEVVEEKQDVVKPTVATKLTKTTTTILYAQETDTGFQLVDSTPKVVFKIKKTGRKDLFLVEGEDSVIYKQDGKWIYEYNTDAGMKQKELNIKF
ncbi:hypothetical protein PK35_13860 [Tamlana nanhaiensis]|uniref:Uncharacterized protein n=1 Tax=Neotamlana nanhaiensis TaxID=1382798 RepID=A0A0D7W0X1_9FLAO|nr:hypothetical protein [Tamlana nanhaiensis]KJD31497.1 hypothetical protein PK35_13860 [Tamlana nanhaiensis]